MQTPSSSGSAPLFGLRWVPDSQLRPLRYMPAANLPASSRPSHRDSDRDDSDWWRGRPAASPVAPLGDATADEVGASSASALKLQQSVRVLTQRLSEAQESVRQKSEQIRWLKEMTKDDASRARVARWMRGPLLRVFTAWKRCVRDSSRAALDDLNGELASANARHKELQAKCDELSRDHAVLQAALDHFFDASLKARARGRLLACWRRWTPLRLQVRGWSRTLGEAVHGLPARRGAAQARAFAALRRHARIAGTLGLLAARLTDRRERLARRRAFRWLHKLTRRTELEAALQSAAPVAIQQRAGLARLRRQAGSLGRLRRLRAALLPQGRRRVLRRSWGTWMAVALQQLRALASVEAERAQRAGAELAAKQVLLTHAQAAANVAQVSATLWSDDELPAMLESLAEASAGAARAAATAALPIDGGAPSSHGADGPEAVDAALDAAAEAAAFQAGRATMLSAAPNGGAAAGGKIVGGKIVGDAMASVASRQEAALAAASWQGTQLKLALAVLDSLKRELARERAALASSRADGKQSDQVAEAALAMLQQLREEGAALHGRLAQLEEAKLRTEQALVRRDAELFESGRAQHAAARALGGALAQLEEKTYAQLQSIDARCEARSQQVVRLQSKVARATQGARARQLDSWAEQLTKPLAAGR